MQKALSSLVCLPHISLSGTAMFGLETQCDFNSLIPFGLSDLSDGDERPGDPIFLCPEGNPLYARFQLRRGGGRPSLFVSGWRLACGLRSDLICWHEDIESCQSGSEWSSSWASGITVRSHRQGCGGKVKDSLQKIKISVACKGFQLLILCLLKRYLYGLYVNSHKTQE